MIWSDVLATLVAGDDLSDSDARWAMEHILSGQASEAQIAAFLVAMRAKGESASEVSALMDVMNAHAVAVDVNGVVVDVVGTGGDSSHSVNISTMSAIVVAACGVPVVKHGNRAASSQTGTADVLEEIGISLSDGPAEVAARVAQNGIAFCFAPNFHPAMRFAGPVRKQLGIATIFNILGPLANPANATAGLIGCADRDLAPVMAETLARRGDRALVVRGDDGLDEITTFTTTRVWDTTSGSVKDDIIDPRDFDIQRPHSDALRGGDRTLNARILVDVIHARRNEPNLAAIADAVTLNAAGALVAYDAAMRHHVYGVPEAPVATRIASALPVARNALESGAAGAVLDRWIDASS